MALTKEQARNRVNQIMKSTGLTIEDLRTPEASVAITPDAWEKLFPPMTDPIWDDVEFKVFVEELLIESGIHVAAGLFESYKTMGVLALVSAVRQPGKKAFEHFAVKGKPCEVIWCNYDMPPALLKKYTTFFGLHKDKGFRPSKPKGDVFLLADDPILQQAVKERLLVVDTMLDMARIQEAFKSGEWGEFFRKLRLLIDVHGCRGIILITHPTKAGARNTVIDATEFLKDSVTFGGKIDVAFAFRKLPKTGKIFVERIKGRGWEKPITFTLASHDQFGDSNIGRGIFPVCDKPGAAGELNSHLGSKGGRPAMTFTDEQLDKVGVALRSLEMEGKKPSQRNLALALRLKDTEKEKAQKMRDAYELRELNREDEAKKKFNEAGLGLSGTTGAVR
jgi:hypothetical protein